MNPQSSELQKVSELAAKYAREGYEVILEPKSEALPFDLGGYRPDLLVHKGDEHYLIEVKPGGVRLPIERFRELAEEVGRHEGWHFLLVPTEAPSSVSADERLLSWDQLKGSAEQAEKLLGSGEAQAAYLLLWAILEGILRRRAKSISLPIERFPTSALIKHMYSQGELSFEQFNEATEAFGLRSQVAHGFQASNVSEAVPRLLDLVRELLRAWAPRIS